jgi:hypothetical protein
VLENYETEIVDSALAVAIVAQGGAHNLPLLLPALRHQAQELLGKPDFLLQVNALVARLREDPVNTGVFRVHPSPDSFRRQEEALSPPSPGSSISLDALPKLFSFAQGWLTSARLWLAEVWVQLGKITLPVQPKAIGEAVPESTSADSSDCDCTVVLQEVRVRCRNGMLELDPPFACPNCLGEGRVQRVYPE